MNVGFQVTLSLFDSRRFVRVYLTILQGLRFRIRSSMNRNSHNYCSKSKLSFIQRFHFSLNFFKFVNYCRSKVKFVSVYQTCSKETKPFKTASQEFILTSIILAQNATEYLDKLKKKFKQNQKKKNTRVFSIEFKQLSFRMEH